MIRASAARPTLVNPFAVPSASLAMAATGLHRSTVSKTRTNTHGSPNRNQARHPRPGAVLEARTAEQLPALTRLLTAAS